MTAQRKDRRKARAATAGGVVALAVLLGWCGHGWLGGGDGAEDGDSLATPTASAPAEPAQTRCQLRVDADGVAVDGTPAAIADAVAACKAAGEADLLVTGDAVYGTVQTLESALDQAGVRVYAAQRGN